MRRKWAQKGEYMGFVNAVNNSGVSAVDMFAAHRKNQPKENVGEMFSQLVKEKKAECLAGIRNGNSGQSFQIGAGSYTETEWKKLLAGFDVSQAKFRVAAEGENTEAQRVATESYDNFLETRVVDGVPNYLNAYETGMTINTKAAGYSKYMNQPDFVKNMCYTSEEAFQTFFNHRKVDENKKPGHEVIDTNHLDEYYAKHRDEIGKRKHYYNGRWYSMAELTAVWDKELAELFGQG